MVLGVCASLYGVFFVLSCVLVDRCLFTILRPRLMKPLLLCMCLFRCVYAQFCSSTCAAGQYPQWKYTNFFMKMNVHADFMKSNAMEIGMLANAVTQKRDLVCFDCQHNISKDTFDFVQTCDDSDECFDLSQHCTVKCRTHFIRKDSDCVLCNHTTCDVGYYMERDTCGCLPCAHQIRSTITTASGLEISPINSDVKFITNGLQLNDSASCLEACKSGFFRDSGLIQNQESDVCIAHTNLSNMCSDTQFKLNGTQFEDARCEDCIFTCPAANMTQNCSEFAQSVCVDCEGSLLENEEFTMSNCTRRCVEGAVRNENGDCEICSTICDPGYHHGQNASVCDCLPCNTLPKSNATYVQGCLWACNDGYEYNSSTNNCEERTPEINFAPVYAKKSFITSCPAGEYLQTSLLPRSWTSSAASRTKCLSCHDKVATPDPNLEGSGSQSTWNWLLISNQDCAWECKSGFYAYSTNAETVTCYTWEQFAERVDTPGALETVVSADNQEIVFTPAQRKETKMITDWQIVMICIVALVTTRVLLQS